jgi:hypothetical protein
LNSGPGGGWWRDGFDSRVWTDGPYEAMTWSVMKWDKFFSGVLPPKSTIG